MTGYEDGTFKPDNKITRAEFITAMLRFKNIDISSSTTNFVDIDSSQWYNYFIATAVDKHYISGYPDGSFRPDAYITRAEAITVINNVMKINTDNSIPAEKVFNDLDETHWAYNQIMLALN